MLARNKGLFAEPMTCWSQAAAREPGFSWCSVGSAPPRLSPIERTFGLLAAAIREEASHTRVETTVMGKVFNASTGEDYHTRDTRLLPEQTSTPHRYSVIHQVAFIKRWMNDKGDGALCSWQSDWIFVTDGIFYNCLRSCTSGRESHQKNMNIYSHTSRT